MKRWIRLAQDGRFRRKEGAALLEGPRLLAAALERDVSLRAILVAEDALARPEIRALVDKAGGDVIEISTSVFNAIADAESPQGVAAEIAVPAGAADAQRDSAFLEGVQDAGNVGAIIRSAAAFGIGNLYLDRNCADPWSPKVLRAAAGGHFQVAILEGNPPEKSRLICTVARNGIPLKEADLSGPLCWVFGSEGKGVSLELQRKAALRVTIAVEPGTESLNVAAAAAICLHQAFSRRAGRS